MPIDLQLVVTRGIMELMMQPENVLTSVKKELATNHYLEEKCKTLQEKYDFMVDRIKNSVPSYTFALSYVGNISFGKEIDAYLEDFDPVLGTSVVPMVLEIICYQGKFCVNYTSSLETDPYLEAICEEFRSQGIPVKCEVLPDFEECMAAF